MQEAEMDHLDRLESESVYIMREAYKKYQKPAMLWSGGKDSTVLAHLTRKAFLGKVPIPAIYIDSVPSDSPIILRRKNGVDITSIEDLWMSTNSSTKTMGKGEEIKKVENVETFNGKSSWTPIKYIIRHPYSGKILRLNTLTSAVDVSPNHSVMTPKKNGWKARDASEIKVGDRIATSEIVPRPNIGQGRKGGFFIGTEDLAWLYGLFVAEGSAYKTTRSDNKKYSHHFVSISNKDEELLEKTKSIISDNFHVKSSINEDSGCKKLALSNKSMYEFFKSNFYTQDGSKKIPKSVLIAPKEVKKSFIKGYDEGDGSHSRDMGKSLDSFTSKSQPLMAGLLWLATEVDNQDYSVHIREDKPNISQIMFNKPESKRRKSTKKVKKIIEYDYEGYLYDLETEDHAFYSGVGLPVRLHNTGYHFDEMYEFRDKLAEDWDLNLVIAKNEEAEEKGITPEDKLECCGMRKTQALKDTIAKHGFDALLVGIRRDEHGIRAKERYFCFPPETPIYGEGVKSIGDIGKGDSVFTHTGQLRKVLDVSTRDHDGNLVRLTPTYGVSLLLTPNHPVLSKKPEGTGKFTSYELEGFDGKVHKGTMEIMGKSKVDWREARRLERGDWIFIPNVSASKGKTHILLEPYLEDQEELVNTDGNLYYKSAHTDSLWIENKVKLDKDFLRIIGYYVAEGSFCSSANQLSFAFHENEEGMIEDLLFTMKKTFNINGSVRKKGKCKEILFNSKILGLFFSRLCGESARKKRLPNFFIHLENEKLVELIKGCWLGDGSHEKYSTSSTKLAHQLRLALLKLGILASVKKKSRKELNQFVLQVAGSSKRKFEDNFGIRSKIAYEGRFDMVKEVGETPRVNKEGPHPSTGGRWIRVKSVNTVPYSGKLYNLHVDEHKTYLPQGIAVHNSPRDQDFRWNYKDQPPELWDQYKSQREAGQHLRVHPLLSWTELDVWKYIKREGLPVNPLYFAEERDGKMTRFRSLGCKPCTEPIESEVASVEDMITEIKESSVEERSGRAQDKEEAHAMQKLRALGYF